MHVLIWMKAIFLRHIFRSFEEYFNGRPVVYGCDDHRLRVANSEPQEQRSAKAKATCGDKKLQLRILLRIQERMSMRMMIWFLILLSFS